MALNDAFLNSRDLLNNDKISSSLRGGLIGATLGLLGTSLFFDILGSGISNDGQIGLVFVFFPCYGTIAVGVGYGIGILFSKIKKLCALKWNSQKAQKSAL